MKMKIKELLEKITIKRCIAKIRFSHVMCICIGVLIPIYVDVLFLHGFDSSTVSAIMDTFLVGFAAYAAYQVRDWLKDKVKNKGFEHAEKLLMNLHQSYIMLFYIKDAYDKFCEEYVECRELSSEEENEMNNKAMALISHSSALNLKLAELLAEISTLKSWDMHCSEQDVYQEYISQCEKVRECIESFITSAIKMRYFNRHHKWKRSKDEIESLYNQTSNMYNQLEIRFESVFFYKRKSQYIN